MYSFYNDVFICIFNIYTELIVENVKIFLIEIWIYSLYFREVKFKNDINLVFIFTHFPHLYRVGYWNDRC